MIYKTSDLALAAYMITKGMILSKAIKLDSGRYHFEIEYDEDGGGTVSDSEKEPIHHLRLVR